MAAKSRATIQLEGAFAEVSEANFYIPATGPASRPRRTLKHDDTFVVVDSHGDIGVSAGGPDGLFHADTRHLSRFEFCMNGLPPLLLGSNLRDDNTALTVDLTNPDLFVGERLLLGKDTVHVLRTLFVWRGTLYQRFALRNFGSGRVSLRLSFGFDSDFADVFEVRGMRREKRGRLGRASLSDQVILTYQGVDDIARDLRLVFSPTPTTLERASAEYLIELQPQESRRIFVTSECNEQSNTSSYTFLRGLRDARRERRALTSDAASVETSNEILNEVLCRAAADIRILTTKTATGPYPYAGIPWYSTTFGRDGLITALQMLWLDPSIALGVLRRVAAYQATADNPAADAQEGKILHEMRSGEMARLGEIPFGLYYGSVDATPLFVLLAGLYVDRTDDEQTLRELWPSIEAGLRWIDRGGDPDRDGFVEYERASEQGLLNQGWKDSQDAVHHSDGSLATGPIALAEVQGYVYAAKRAAARCCRRLGKLEQASRLDSEAEWLAARFDDAFWSPELETYVLALDGAKRQCRVRTSNAGQVLFTGIVPLHRAKKLAEELLQPHFFSGWGVRTVANGEVRYNPMSYHNGSVWPHDNALIALGFARYGFKEPVARLFSGLFDAAAYMEFRRLPELFCGFRRSPERGPTLYPVACAPQAWASASIFTFLEASLGLELDPAKREIRLRRPHLPIFLNEIVLRNLHLGRARVDLRIHRDGATASVEVLKGRDETQVSVLSTCAAESE
jgi:glycogen debranching enzyme